MTALLLAVLAAGGIPASATPSDAMVPVAASTAAVKVWMNQDRRFREGDRARLQVDAEVEGYLLVLHYDTDGRVQVLFPLEPRDDNRVRAGRRYEVLDESGREAFLVGGSGTGIIYTAISEDPWRLDDVSLEGRWDYTKLAIDRRSRDPEGDLTEVAQKIAGPHGFDYDVLGYRVEGEDRYGGLYPVRTVYLPGDYLYCNNWYWRYDNCRRWPYDGGWSFGASIYFGGYSPYDYFYSPYAFGYYPYGYGYGSYGYGYGGRGYYPYIPTRGGFGRGPVLVGRPRGYIAEPRSALGGSPRNVVSSGSGFGGRPVAPAIDWRGRAPARPVREAGGRYPEGMPAGGNVAAPPARRARPDGSVYPAARGGGGRNEGAVRERGRDSGARGPSGREAPPAARGGGSGGGGGHASGSGGGGRPAPSSSGRSRRP